MTFLEPCKKDEYFGTGQFHLRLLKTIPAQPQKKYLPAYLFEMVANGQPVGRCTLRVGYNDLVEYAGNIGYEVEEEHRGHHYALISCRLLLRLARRHRMEEVLITCREDNFASRRTCEQLGATPAGRVDVPVNHEMYRADSDAPLLQYRYRLGLELRPITEQELVEVGKLYECDSRPAGGRKLFRLGHRISKGVDCTRTVCTGRAVWFVRAADRTAGGIGSV